MNPKTKLFVVILLSCLLFSPSLLNFFSSDDWFHLRISQIDSTGEFLNFFSFLPNSQSASFYRPLSTQVFFFGFQKIFGLNPIPYHVFVLLIFAFSLYLVYLFTRQLVRKDTMALFATLIYGISVTNFTRLYFLSAFQEIVMVVFVLLALISYLRPKTPLFIPVIFFIFSLLSKETAIVLPLLIIMVDWYEKRLNIKRILPFILISLAYLLLRLLVFQTVVGDSYIWDFSPFRALNTLFWYSLWLLGAPEFLVDYIGSGLRPIPTYLTNFGIWAYLIPVLIAVTALPLLFLLIKQLTAKTRSLVFVGLFILISLLPVLFLPWHKFTLELSLPLVGFAILTTIAVGKFSKSAKAFLWAFIVLNLSMNYLTYVHHYSVNRAHISRAVYSYFQSHHPQAPTVGVIMFINDTVAINKNWGSSRQISNAISGSELFRVLYRDPYYQVFYEDHDPSLPPSVPIIQISTKMFIDNAK